MKNKQIIIGITMGDAAGIGPEIILDYFKRKINDKSILPFIIGNYEWIQYVNNKLSVNLSIKKISDINLLKKDKHTYIYDKDSFDLSKTEIGKVNKLAGNASGRFIELAVDLALKNDIDGIVTAPINKDSLNQGGYIYQGHTEMLAHLTSTKDYIMMLMGKWLKTILVTTHIALKDVSKNITIDKIIQKIMIANNSLKKDFGISKPRLAVLALNPHCGENGLMGDEENKIIIPALQMLKTENINVSGPFSADTFFSYAEGKYDGVVCMYHDQGLIPLKLISFGQGVNVTLGLPIVRTSVDHGTGYDIVHKNIADSGSLSQAVNIAVEIVCNRCKF